MLIKYSEIRNSVKVVFQLASFPKIVSRQKTNRGVIEFWEEGIKRRKMSILFHFLKYIRRYRYFSTNKFWGPKIP